MLRGNRGALQLVACLLIVTGNLRAQVNPGAPWPATDALGRSMPPAVDVRAPRPDRFVGIFYFLWHDRNSDRLPNDLARLLRQDPDLLRKPDSPLWRGKGMYYWGEPLYGYYNSRDPWVIRRHATLLADAGVDTIIFDTTNRQTYPEVYRAICEAWSQMLRERAHVPRLCFMVNTKAGETAEELYRELYKPGLYRELWFYWQGKPLLICDPSKASEEVKQFFTLRKAHCSGFARASGFGSGAGTRFFSVNQSRALVV